MKSSPAVTALVKRYQTIYNTPHEGLIGWGHKVVGEYEERDYAAGIDEAEAERLLALDILSADVLMESVLGATSVELPQHKYDALTSLALDSHNLNTSFILKYVLGGNDESVAREFVKWGAQIKGGTTAERRAAESRLYFTGSFVE